MDSIKLYMKYSIMNIRCKMQYKAWPFYILGQAINAMVNFITVRLMFARFGSLDDWTSSHTLMVYGIAVTAFALSEWFSRGFDTFPRHVRYGLFDKILLQPRNTFLQVMGEQFEFERCGKIIIGIICISIASNNLAISWDILSILVLIGAIIGGFFLYTFVYVVFAGISFFSVGAIDMVYIFTDHSQQYSQIPLHTMPAMVKNMLTFIFPIAICYYYPALYIIEKSDNILAFIALPVGLFFFGMSLIFWKFASSHYHSTGS